MWMRTTSNICSQISSWLSRNIHIQRYYLVLLACFSRDVTRVTTFSSSKATMKLLQGQRHDACVPVWWWRLEIYYYRDLWWPLCSLLSLDLPWIQISFFFKYIWMDTEPDRKTNCTVIRPLHSFWNYVFVWIQYLQ